MKKRKYGGVGTLMNFSPIVLALPQYILCHFKADTYDITLTK